VYRCSHTINKAIGKLDAKTMDGEIEGTAMSYCRSFSVDFNEHNIHSFTRSQEIELGAIIRICI
jgi:hypothetical protein